jgi:hypothetical protein
MSNCPDCGRRVARRMPKVLSTRGSCARAFHPVGADHCMEVTFTRLRTENASLTAKNEAQQLEIARLRPLSLPKLHALLELRNEIVNLEAVVGHEVLKLRNEIARLKATLFTPGESVIQHLEIGSAEAFAHLSWVESQRGDMTLAQAEWLKAERVRQGVAV